MMSTDTKQEIKQQVKPAEDQSWSGWKNYFAEGFKYMRSETWQLAVDAKNEGWNIISDINSNTRNITYDIYMADKYQTTPHPSKESAHTPAAEGEIFSIDKFHRDEESQSTILKEEPEAISMGDMEKKAVDLPPM